MLTAGLEPGGVERAGQSIEGEPVAARRVVLTRPQRDPVEPGTGDGLGQHLGKGLSPL